MRMFKGFTKDMKCRDFQFEEGKTYEEENAELCKTGFHACEAPLDCFDYYGPANSVYHVVELDATEEQHPDDTKRVGKRIKIGARLSIANICEAQFEYVKSHCTNENNAEPGKAASAGDHGAASAGYRGAASAGDHGAASAGEYGAASAGYRGAASAGYHGAASAGYHGAASAGEYGAASAGYHGAACSRGSADVGDNGVACVRGNNVKVKGGMGAILVIAKEYKNDYDIETWKAFVIDGKNYLPDTWYTLKNGEITVAEEQDEQ